MYLLSLWTGNERQEHISGLQPVQTSHQPPSLHADVILLEVQDLVRDGSQRHNIDGEPDGPGRVKRIFPLTSPCSKWTFGTSARLSLPIAPTQTWRPPPPSLTKLIRGWRRTPSTTRSTRSGTRRTRDPETAPVNGARHSVIHESTSLVLFLCYNLSPNND